MPDKTVTEISLHQLHDMINQAKSLVDTMGASNWIEGFKAKHGEDRVKLFLNLIKKIDDGELEFSKFVRARLIEHPDGSKEIDLRFWSSSKG